MVFTIKHRICTIGVSFLYLLLAIFLMVMNDVASRQYIGVIGMLIGGAGITEIYFGMKNNNVLYDWGSYAISGLYAVSVGFLLLKNDLKNGQIIFLIQLFLMVRGLFLFGTFLGLRNFKFLKWKLVAFFAFATLLLSNLMIYDHLMHSRHSQKLMAVNFMMLAAGMIILSYYLYIIEKRSNKVSVLLKMQMEHLEKKIYNAYQDQEAE